MADVAASVLAKLRNKAKASGISYQQCLQLFVQEEFLRKLSKSGCEDTLILKGGLFIYTLTNFESRATIDVDFLLRGYSNSIDDVKELICKIIDTPTGNDYIEMRAKGFEEISPQRKYHGISTQIIAQIKNVRVPFNVDIGVGDIIVPRAEERTINTQLPDFEAPVIKTYSLESTIAEKFDAILQRFELTGRMKDFYDIYYLSRTFDFEGEKLQAAIFETLQRRGTPYDRDSFMAKKKSIEELIEKELKPQVFNLKEKLSTYKGAIECQKEIDILKKLSEQKTADMIENDTDEESELKFKVKEHLDYSFINELSNGIKSFLENCNYDNLLSVIFDKADMDIVINGKKKSSNGKGYNAYFNSVVAIVLSRYMESKAKYSPDFLVLDSPILSLKEKETKKPSETMRNTLFENIVDNQKGIQTIVIENEIPEINYKDANIIHFTKEKNNGRYGFLLDVAD